MKCKYLFDYIKGALALSTVCFCSVGSVFGQQPLPQAALRFANASAIPAKVTFTNDGRSLRLSGFAAGEYTSAFGTPAGSHRLSASAVGAKSVEKTFGLQPNTATTIVAFTRPVFDPQTRQTVQT